LPQGCSAEDRHDIYDISNFDPHRLHYSHQLDHFLRRQFGNPEFPVQLGFALLVTVVIVGSCVIARRIKLPRTDSKSGASGA
jgi:hypothetical protein